MTPKIQIIIVDDHEVYRKGLRMLLNDYEDIVVIAEASNGEEFLNLPNISDADIVLMDIKMPIMNGIEATQAATEKYPNVKIIAISMFGEEEYLENMINAGVEGFLLKNIGKDELYTALQLIYNGKNYFSPELMRILTSKIAQNHKNDKSSNKVDFKISKRELEVLQLICKGYTNNEIADLLSISQRTVDGHRANLISKTESKNTVNLVTFAIKNKLVEM